MRKCSKCGKEKPLSDFAKNGDYLRRDCKECHYKVRDKVRARNRTKAINLIDEKRSKGCEVCGELRPYCLDFHHVDKESKMYDCSAMKNGMTEKKVIEELEKCIVVCANCHREIHKDDDWSYSRQVK